MEGKKWAVSIKTPPGAPPEYARHALEAGRRKAGNELYNILWGYKLPAVVDIEETSIHHPESSMPEYRFFSENELIIEITVTPVQHRHVVMSHVPELDFLLPVRDYSEHPVKKTIQKFANWLAKIAG